jgi:hypothetical protein
MKENHLKTKKAAQCAAPLDNIRKKAYNKSRKGPPVDGWPKISYEVTAWFGAWRLLLFNVYHKVNHHDDQNTKLNKISQIDVHNYHPPFLGNGGH